MEFAVSHDIAMKRLFQRRQQPQHASTQPDSSERLSSTPCAVYSDWRYSGVLCILRGQHAASSPGPAIPRSMGPKCRCLHDGIALSTGMFFPYRPDNPKALRINSSCSRYPRPDSSVNRRIRQHGAAGNSRFSSRVVIQERLTCGSDATDAYSGHTPYQSAYRSLLKPVQIASICAIRRRLFRTTAEVHPAEFIQLRLQMVYFALPVAQLFLQGVDQRFLFGQALFQQEDVVRRDVVHKPVFYRAYSVTTRIKRFTAWSGRSAAA